MSIVFANLLAEMNPQENPLESLKDALAFGVSDWGRGRDVAWVYGIVIGWDDADEPGEDAMGEVARRFRWDAVTVARLRRLHDAFEALDVAT